MRWLASNWFLVLFLAGMAWMHLRHGAHGAHGGHGGRGEHPSPPADRSESSTTERSGHREPTTAGGVPNVDPVGPPSAPPNRAQ